MPDNDEMRPASRVQPAALGLGERLRSARKAKALSVAQVSEALHLEEALVVALEEERFAALGAPVFVRGHLRRYAQLVGLPVQSVLDAYLAASPESSEPPALTRRRTESELTRVGPMALWVAGAVVLVGLAMFLASGDEEPATAVVPAAPADAAQAALPRDPVPLADPISPVAAVLDSSPAATPVEPAQSMAPDSALPANSAAPERVQLVLAFAEDSWVNVTDAERRLLYGLQRAGTRQELTGLPPFRLMLGNARGTTVLVAGNRYAIPPESITDNVARFEIPAPLPPRAPQ